MERQYLNIVDAVGLHAITEQRVKDSVEALVHEALVLTDQSLNAEVELNCFAEAPPAPQTPGVNNKYYAINFSRSRSPSVMTMSLDQTEIRRIDSGEVETNPIYRDELLQRILGQITSVLQADLREDPRGVNVCRCGVCIEPRGHNNMTLITTGQRRSRNLSRHFRATNLVSTLDDPSQQYVVQSINVETGSVRLLPMGNGFLSPIQSTVCLLRRVN